MRSMLRAAAVALLFPAVASVAQAPAAPLKFAYVNADALMAAAPGRSAADAILSKEGEGYRTQINKMQDSIQGLYAKYQKDEPTLTAAQKETRGNAIRAMETDLQATQQKFQQAFAAHTNEVMAPITDLVKKVIDDIRIEDGYAIIFNNDPQATPIVSADKNLDITDRVVSRLKATPAPTIKATEPATVVKKPAGAPAAPAGVTRPKPPTQ